IIPTYNGLTRGYVDKAVASVLGQTLPPRRFLVIDDGSTDGTAEALRAKFPGVEVRSKANQGLPATRNFALGLVDTTYVAYLDDDDVWEPEKTKVQMDYLARNPHVDFVFCGVTYIDQEDRATGRRLPAGFGHSYPEILLGNSILPPST